MSEHKNISEQIIDLVDEALDSKNFGKLSSSINDLLNPGGTDYRPLDHMKGQTYNQYRQQNAYGGSSAGRAAYEARRKQMMSGQPHDANMGSRPQQIRLQNGAALDQRLFKMPEGEGVFGIILMIFGIMAVVSNGFGLMGELLSFSGLGSLIGRLIAFGISLTVAGVGFELNNRVKRFKTYVQSLKDKLYAAVSDLARAVGKSEDFVQKDLKKMIKKGFFKQGHLDDNESTMIASDELYMQYRETQQRAQQLQAEKSKKEKEMGGLTPEARKVIEKGEEYLKKIKKANEEMPEKEITEKLTRLEMIISKIFSRVKKEPGEARNLGQFMDYYLPTTWKLVSAYQDMESQPVQGENIVTAKGEIMGSLDTINDAFETLLDSMFKEKAWDVSTDISVMKTMMKQDGLTGSDFKASGGAAVAVAPAKRTEPIKEEK